MQFACDNRAATAMASTESYLKIDMALRCKANRRRRKSEWEKEHEVMPAHYGQSQCMHESDENMNK